ncbi:MAG: hypothetical protein WDZ94_00510 [Patescibacteria group bacterium]
MQLSQLRITINSPEAVLFEGEAVSVTSENTIGTFDILPNHTNFISIISNSLTLVRQNKKTENFSFASGVIQCKNNVVTVYVGV